MTSKCGKNKKVAHEAQPSVLLMFLPHFDIICDLLLNRRTTTWNLFDLYNKKKVLIMASSIRLSSKSCQIQKKIAKLISVNCISPKTFFRFIFGLTRTLWYLKAPKTALCQRVAKWKFLRQRTELKMYFLRLASFLSSKTVN